MSNNKFSEIISGWKWDNPSDHSRFIQICISFLPTEKVVKKNLHILFQGFGKLLLTNSSLITMDSLMGIHTANFVFVAVKTAIDSGVTMLALLRVGTLSHHSCLDITKKFALMMTNIFSENGIKLGNIDYRITYMLSENFRLLYENEKDEYINNYDYYLEYGAFISPENSGEFQKQIHKYTKSLLAVGRTEIAKCFKCHGGMSFLQHLEKNYITSYKENKLMLNRFQQELNDLERRELFTEVEDHLQVAFYQACFCSTSKLRKLWLDDIKKGVIPQLYIEQEKAVKNFLVEQIEDLKTRIAEIDNEVSKWDKLSETYKNAYYKPEHRQISELVIVTQNPEGENLKRRLVKRDTLLPSCSFGKSTDGSKIKETISKPRELRSNVNVLETCLSPLSSNKILGKRNHR